MIYCKILIRFRDTHTGSQFQTKGIHNNSVFIKCVCVQCSQLYMHVLKSTIVIICLKPCYAECNDVHII